MPLTQVSPALLDTQAQYTGFKNRIINGGMVIDQRNAGASFTVGNLGYGIDRWLTQAVTVSGTGQQVTGSTGNNKALRITGASGNTTIQVSQRIESVNVYDCASQTVTVSFILYGSTSGSVSVRFVYPTATDNYASTTEPVAGTTVNFTTTATQYSVTRTLDSNANKGVWVLLDFGAVGAGVTRTIEFFQLEKGSTATSFDYRPFGTELALCQRYFQKFTGSQLVLYGYWDGTNSAVLSMPYPVTPRTSPTGLAVSSASHFIVNNSTVGNPTASAVLFNSASLYAMQLEAQVASGGSSNGKACRMLASSSSASIEITGCEL